MKQLTSIIYRLSLIVALTFVFSCNGKNAENSSEAKEIKKEEPKGAIVLTDEQMKSVGIEIGTIEQKNLLSVVKASGQLAVPPQNKAEVNVLVGGIIQVINVREGQSIVKGQVVAFLENTDFIKLQQDYLSAKNGFTYTKAEYQRQKELKEADAGTGKIYQQAEANYNADQSKLLGMERQLEQFGINPTSVVKGNIVRKIAIKAPISGTVGHIAINTGTFAEPGKPLMEIIDNSKIHCDLTVYEKDLFKVKNGQKVTFTLTNQNNQQIFGEIYGVNKSFEDESKGIVVHAEIKGVNKYHLIPGMYVTALIDVGQQLTPSVPVEAVVRSENKEFIFILTGTKKEEHEDEGGKKHQVENYSFRNVEVTTGVTELGYIQITPLEELPSGTQIVSKGAFYILSKTKGGTEE
jgi:membrane fusion protein, heavy metal efflux system